MTPRGDDDDYRPASAMMRARHDRRHQFDAVNTRMQKDVML